MYFFPDEKSASDDDFKDVTELLGPADMKKLYDELPNLKKVEVEKDAKKADCDDLDIIARTILREWRKRVTKLANRKTIIKALYNAGNSEVANQLKIQWRGSSQK